MLGGLARWLRAAGYDAGFAPRIDDGALVARALRERAVLLTSDGPLMERRKVTSGEVRALFVPRARPVLEQTAFVLRTMTLTVLDVPRCMRCGGLLQEASRESVVGDVPAASLAAFDTFYRCERCARVLWRGSHWAGIESRLAQLVRETS